MGAGKTWLCTHGSDPLNADRNDPEGNSGRNERRPRSRAAAVSGEDIASPSRGPVARLPLLLLLATPLAVAEARQRELERLRAELADAARRRLGVWAGDRLTHHNQPDLGLRLTRPRARGDVEAHPLGRIV